MTILDAIIIGIVEGVTEFLPISSTGHMIVAGEFLGLVQDDALTSFEIIVQFSAMCALMVYMHKHFQFTKQIFRIMCLCSVPLFLVGFLFADRIKSLFSVQVVAWAFIVGGIVFLLTEYFYIKKNSVEHKESVVDISPRDFLLVALAQVCSLVPGTSRSGATIVAGLWVGMSRKLAAEISFLLAIPAILGVTAYDLLFSGGVLFEMDFSVVILGFLAAFASAYAALVFFVRFIGRYSFSFFGIYRILFGVFLLLFFVK